MQSPFNPYMGVASRSPFYDILSSPLMSGMYGDTNNGLGPNAGTQNDSMVGGVPDQNAQAAFGTDVLGAPAAPEPSTAFNGTIGPGFNSMPEATSPNMGMSQAMGTNVSAPAAPNNNTTPSNSGWGATVTNVAGVPVGQPAATTPAKSNQTAPMGLPAATVMNAPTQAVNNPSVGLNAGIDYGGQSDPQGPAGAGNPGAATSPDQDPTGGIGAGSTAPGGSAATGMATGQDSGQHGSFGGGTAFGGGSGDGGNGGMGGGPNGVGNSNDAGSGTPGAGQSGESGQWAKGGRITHQSPFLVDPNPFNADDMPIEAQKDEHVMTVKASKGIGRKFLDTANKEFEKKGADRKAILKKLGPLLGKD